MYNDQLRARNQLTESGLITELIDDTAADQLICKLYNQILYAVTLKVGSHLDATVCVSEMSSATQLAMQLAPQK